MDREGVTFRTVTDTITIYSLFKPNLKLLDPMLTRHIFKHCDILSA
jgi:hypothetical protein